jgi:hypothetical protein
VQLTRDGGRTWRNVTPPDLGAAQINALDASPHDAGTAWVAAHRYRFGDLAPLVLATADYGATWRLRVAGLPDDASLRVVREDPARRGLLYAGTATGLFLSFDGGERWQPFQANLPVVPVTDLEVRNGDLVASTEGRAFWILDDLSPLRQLDAAVAGARFHLFQPRDAYRVELADDDEAPADCGRNPPDGVVLYYLLSEEAARTGPPPEIEILDAEGVRLRRLRPGEGDAGDGPAPGLNRLVWNLRRDEVPPVPGLLRLPRTGYRLAPGTYRARLTIGAESMTQSFELLADPRLESRPEDFAEQQRLLAEVWETLAAVHRAAAAARELRREARQRAAEARRRELAEVAGAADALAAAITAWEPAVVEPRQESLQDFVSLPARLNAQLMFLLLVLDSAEPAVTRGARQRFADLSAEWAACRARMAAILGELPALGELLARHSLPSLPSRKTAIKHGLVKPGSGV